MPSGAKSFARPHSVAGFRSPRQQQAPYLGEPITSPAINQRDWVRSDEASGLPGPLWRHMARSGEVTSLRKAAAERH